jgi:beta-galactosidase
VIDHLPACVSSPSAGAMNGLDELYLRIRYEGDVARLYDGGKLLTDDFFNGLDWQVGLKRYLATKDAKTLELEILPLRQDAPVYFETPRKVAFGSSRQVGNVESVRLLPEYELVLGVPAR